MEYQVPSLEFWVPYWWIWSGSQISHKIIFLIKSLPHSVPGEGLFGNNGWIVHKCFTNLFFAFLGCQLQQDIKWKKNPENSVWLREHLIYSFTTQPPVGLTCLMSCKNTFSFAHFQLRDPNTFCLFYNFPLQNYCVKTMQNKFHLGSVYAYVFVKLQPRNLKEQISLGSKPLDSSTLRTVSKWRGLM